MLGKIEGGRNSGRQRMRWLDGIIDSMDMSLSKFQDMVKHREAWHAAVHGSQGVGLDRVTEQQLMKRSYIPFSLFWGDALSSKHQLI